jgi:glutamate-1-semialdehyde 2,1-aminomutase
MTTTATLSIDQLLATYAENNPNSKQLFQRAQESLPGGNTRTGTFFPPFPIYIDRGEGPYLVDVDGHELIDFVNNQTALILGHAHPEVVRALQEQTAKGTAFSRPTLLEIEMAELLRERVPSMERVRLCSSGTEAVLNAFRAARAFTGRSKIAKFEGAYHGMDVPAMISHVPALGPQLGDATNPKSVASTAGLPAGAEADVLVLPFNDAPACEALISAHADKLAAVVVDPVSSGAGLAAPRDGFLTELREMTSRAGSLLIFDEIISFRVARGGAQELYGVRPDLTTLGKVIAGGTAGAAFGGREDLMAAYDPTAGKPSIPHNGTYNGWPLAMVAGITTLRRLTPEVYEELGVQAERIGSELNDTFETAGLRARVAVIGSIFRIHFTQELPSNYREAAAGNKQMHRWLFFWLLNNGINWAEHGNVSIATKPEQVDRFVETVAEAVPHLEAMQ